MSGCNFIKIAVYLYNYETTFAKYCDSFSIVF